MPLVGLTVSHDESLDAVKDIVPLPEFVTVTVPDAGFTPLPWTAVNDRVDVERPSAELFLEKRYLCLPEAGADKMLKIRTTTKAQVTTGARWPRKTRPHFVFKVLFPLME